ncbi:MAG: baseplate J/gp47 family protein [Spirochaetota bacterium]|nr:baseplate J/gp47 family protein [Spirochaetota bacterium]
MKTRQSIASEIFEQCKKEIPQVSNFKSGGVFRLFIEIIASFLEKLYQESDDLLANRFVQTASGDCLTIKSKELGIENRFLTQKTQGYVVFSRNKADDTIPIDKNKIIATKPNTQGQVFRFKVVDDVLFIAKEKTLSVLVEAEEYGSRYNVPINTITEFITTISGVDSVINNSTQWIVRLGREEENDEELRLRCLSIWQGLSGANKEAYVAWAKSVSGVGNVKVIGTPENKLGEILIVCTGINNIQASPEIIHSVQQVIDSRKPIATDIVVKAPVEVFVPLNITLYTYSTLNKDAIKEQVEKFFMNQFIGQNFEPSALIAHFFKLPEIKSVVINTPSTTFNISDIQIARQNINADTDITIYNS